MAHHQSYECGQQLIVCSLDFRQAAVTSWWLKGL